MKGCMVNRKHFEKIIEKFDFYDVEPDIFLDVGVGGPYPYEAWWFKEKWPDIGVIGFEPCKERYFKIIPEKFTMDSNTKLVTSCWCGGGFPGQLLREAVTDLVGDYSGYMNDYDFRVSEDIDEDDPYKVTNVLSTTIDELIFNRLKVDGDDKYKFESAFIWADIEGGEMTLLKGATKSLEEKRIFGLNLELWPNPPVKDWPSPDEIVEYLERYGYYVAFGEEGSYNDWDRKSQMDFFFMRKD